MLSHVTESVEPRKRTPRTFKQRWAAISIPNKLMVYATVVIALASVINLFVAVRMWIEVRNGSVDTHTLAVAAGQSLLNAKEQFAADQRPYVWIAPGSNPVESLKQVVFRLQSGLRPVEIIVYYSNYGRSPAIVTGVSTDAEIAPNAVRKLHRVPWQESDAIIPTNVSDAVYIYSTESVSPSNRMSLAIKNSKGTDEFLDDAVAAYARIRYRDLDGHRYETDLCFVSRRGLSPLEYCPSKLGFTRMIDCEKELCGQ
jgi:hypothetical protein